MCVQKPVAFCGSELYPMSLANALFWRGFVHMDTLHTHVFKGDLSPRPVKAVSELVGIGNG